MGFLSDKYISISIEGVEIDLSHSSATSSLMGVLRAAKGDSLTLDAALVSSLSPELGAIVPSGLSLAIDDVLAAKSGKTKVLSATIGASFSLSDLPLIGHMLPSGFSFKVNSFQVLTSSGQVLPKATQDLNAILPNDLSALPTTLSSGFALAVSVTVGTETYHLNTAQLKQAEQQAQGTNTTAQPSGGNNAQQNVNKSAGPISIQSIGMNLLDEALNLVFQAALAFGPLKLGFEGLSLGSKLSEFSPQVSLKGLSLDYKTEAFSIGGAFLHEGPGDYAGMFTLMVEELQVTAMGAYNENNGNPSIFIFGMMDEPLGGPACCFVEGIAITFGYNRNFIIPPVTGVSKFPLIEVAAGTMLPQSTTPGAGTSSTGNLSAMLGALNQYIPPETGEYFIGVGLKFTSFEVINSFALLVGKFGRQLQFDLLALSTYVAPDPFDPKPVALVELEVVGSYTPSTGILMIRGMLSPNSFILSSQCHLEGGFAIGNWFKGPYSGDFVYSFGGYGSHYKPPSYYPQNIPALGFQWQIDSNLSVKGGGYWAITPQAIMAGGYLNATFSIGWVRASFDADAYFFIEWKPLHYSGSFEVSLTIQVKIDFLFFSCWIGFERSIALEIHGPPFGGAAGIGLCVCTVWIKFGAAPAPKPLLTASEFVNAFIPSTSGTNNLLSLRITEGLIKKVKQGSDEYHKINPKDFQMTTEAFVPCTRFTANGTAIAGIPFEVKPMGVAFDGVKTKSTLVVTATNLATNQNSSQFSFVADIEKQAPKSIWYNSSGATDAQDDQLSPLLFGLHIKPANPIPESNTSSVARSVLADEVYNAPDWESNTVENFNSTLTAADQASVSAIDTDLFTALGTEFGFANESASDFGGLSSRLEQMGSVDINVGTCT